MGTRWTATSVAFALGVTLLGVTPAPAMAEHERRAALPGVRVQLSVDDKRLTVGESSTMSARLLDASTGDPVIGEPLELKWRRMGTDRWRDHSTLVTGAGGVVEWTGVSSKYSTRYRVVHPQSATWARGVSDVRTVLAKPTVSATLKRDWVRPSGTVRLSGQVRSAYPGERVLLQRRVDGRWTTVRRTEQGDHGRYAFRIRGMSFYGPQRYRVVLPERQSHLGDASEPLELTTVRLVTYRIETRGDIVVSMKEFRRRTDEIYADPRGWSRAYVHFKRVRTGGAFSLVLSEASHVPDFAPICDRYWSCRVGRYVVINQNRWRWGTSYFKKAGGTLREYRAMVVNHETGHWFGLGHASCGGTGKPAPVMMQQSKGLYGCEPNPWPLAWEINRVR